VDVLALVDGEEGIVKEEQRRTAVLLRKVDKGLSDIWFLCREKIAIEGITFSALERQSGRNIRSTLL
jgi:hypothetical protein